MDEEDLKPTSPFPPGIKSALNEILYNNNDKDRIIIDVVWSELLLSNLDYPFALPNFPSHFESVSSFVRTELLAQAEMIRSELCDKVHRLRYQPKDNDKHLAFPLPYVSRPVQKGQTMTVAFHQIHKAPIRGQFTNYVVLFQTLESSSSSLSSSSSNGTMKDLTLAFTVRVNKRDGAEFVLGSDAGCLAELPTGTRIYVRILRNFNMLKTHIRAIAALHQAEDILTKSFVIKQLLAGEQIHEKEMQTLDKLDQWIQSKTDHPSATSSTVYLKHFNKQQQRALALDALTEKGVVLIQGPPGTGKSHIVCHGILPQAVARKERILVVCNSNVAVDALMLKCTNIDSLPTRTLLRCGFKQNVSDDLVNLGLYAEGDIDGVMVDCYGNQSGSNSNTTDRHVQEQIRSRQIIFTTIHFASKDKGESSNDDNASMYWNFDTLVLDEAAQIEDARLFIVLARCPTLQKIILVGDPKQLQPYVPESLRKQGYGKSTMERLMLMDQSDNLTHPEGSRNNNRIHYVMLEEQFRMAPSLRRIVSCLYYKDRLQDGDIVLHRGPVNTVKLQPLLVVNVIGSTKKFSSLHQSYENIGEAMVVNVVWDFLFSAKFDGALPKEAGELTVNDVCVLTPYNRHKDRLRMLICGINEEALDAYSGQTYGGPGSPAKKSQVMYGTQDDVPDNLVAMADNIDTVDKFQGSERKIVIISTCVDHKPLRAADPHFINVACSRAQHLLIVVGNFSHGLATNQDWMHVWNEAKKSGSYIEHSVTEKTGAAGGEDADYSVDIHEDLLRSKLEELLERPSQKLR